MDGKCGTCGDAYDAEVRENEAGGIYATGVIGRNYTRGQVITVFKPFRQPLQFFGQIKCLTHINLSLYSHFDNGKNYYHIFLHWYLCFCFNVSYL